MRKLFTLLEALVASAIIGIFLCVALSGFSAVMRNSRLSSDYLVAVRLAQVKLNELAVMKPLKEMDSSGDFGPSFPRFSWRTSVVKGADGRMFSLHCEVFFSGGRTFSLDTIRLPDPETDKDGSVAGR
jgi:type II secretory pathway pseudopilin PulG